MRFGVIPMAPAQKSSFHDRIPGIRRRTVARKVQWTRTRMISDLENLARTNHKSAPPCDLSGLGAWTGEEPERDQNGVDLGADFLLASSPRRPAPATLRERLVARIAQEPARVETDLEGRITGVNPAFSSLCGFSFAEICGKKPGTFLQGPETDPAAVDVIREAVRTQSSCVTNLVNYHKDGSRYRVRIEIQTVRDADGNPTGFAATETKLPA